MKLVIVESPAKAKTINKYLGSEYHVIASFGHIRDLPSKNGSVLPDQDFAMQYTIAENSEKHVNEIVKAARSADEIYLATDPDREGESISWHITEVIKEKTKKQNYSFKRIAFNEITKTAVLNSINSPRDIDINLVNAQQARRALDYLVGFTLSPLLWRKLPGCRSAGRVQSVALRLICEREEEIEKFKSEEYWNIKLSLSTIRQENFIATLSHINNTKLEKFSITNQQQAQDITEKLKHAHFYVENLEAKQQKRNAPAPFITSSLQQEAARKLGFSAKKTMQIAQKLYEGLNVNGETIGLITYMRTDGVNLSSEAVEATRKLILQRYGQDYLPKSAKLYKSKVQNAQEAHEAIRPTNINLIPEALKSQLDSDYSKLYELIWQRTMACQMQPVVIDQVVVELHSKEAKDSFIARSVGSTIAFDGFYKVYREGQDDDDNNDENTLPLLKTDEDVSTREIIPVQHFTEPPPRYSEASLVKKLEDLGIGRPSTYAPILSVLQDRNYVNLVKKRFIPDERGRLVTSFLTGFFKKYVEYDFTASLENRLDDIASGKLVWKKLLHDFWQGFYDNVHAIEDKKITEVINYLEHELSHHLFGNEAENSRICPECQKGKLSLRLGKYGAFLACDQYPECKFKKTITKNDSGVGDTEVQENNKVIGIDPKSQQEILLKKGPYGWYLELTQEQTVNTQLETSSTETTKTKKSKKNASTTKSVKKSVLPKPKRVSIPPSVNIANITLETAIKLLNLPLMIGIHPKDGNEIILGIGKYGPYLKYNSKFIAISKKMQDSFLDISLQDAVSIITSKSEDKLPKGVKAKGRSKKTNT